MKGTRAASRYAKAILSLAKDKSAAKEVHDDMQSISKTIAGSRDLKDTLASPVVKDSLKKNILFEVFKGLNGVTKGAINTLLENNRIAILDVVALQYINMYNKDNQIQEAVVTTAVALDKELEKVIMAKVKELTGANASLKQVVDESIIGGFILRIGDLQYDASVARNLNNLKRRLKDNTYVSKL